MPRPDALAADWFAGRGWTPFDFQRQVWAALRAGRSGLLHASTGAGKTYAVALGALCRAEALGIALQPGPVKGRAKLPDGPPLGLLWLTPMRALAADTRRALALPLAELAPGWTLGLRSGDTPAAERARQDRRLPTVLVSTPESATLLLTKADAQALLAGVHTVVVDEWHELVGSKRGVQVQLLLARLAAWNPQLAVWGLSATLGNLEPALAMLLGARPAGAAPPLLVRGRVDKTLRIDTLLPPAPGRFCWTGHLGAQLLAPVVDAIADTEAGGGSTLVFTNTRAQAESWYQLLLGARPDWAGRIALHHGSLDRSVRDWVEAGLKAGTLTAVVATSSLDLGVDFLPVARVLQVGSAKGVARLLQRAGRSGHQPGRASRITLVPTNTLELVEAVALRRAVAAGRIESRQAPEQPLDVLVQHLVTVALGGGFEADALFAEVRQAWSYRALDRADFDWALDFVVRGGAALSAYPEHHRVRLQDGVHRVEDRGIALRHRLQVGTIVGASLLTVQWWTRAGGGGGAALGQVDEGFIARLNPGDCFVFAGRLLELVRTREMVAYVRQASVRRGLVPSWSGGRLGLSGELADQLLAVLVDAGAAGFAAAADEPELACAAPMLAAQQALSRLPAAGRLLVEQQVSREGNHLFVYPFAGREVHLGLASLLAWRLAQQRPTTFSIAVNDCGFELLSADAPDLAGLFDGRLFEAGADLRRDLLASLNSSELARRRFREIARVAGLVQTGYPGAPRSSRQLQASAGLFHDVFRQHDPANRLLAQADAEVLAQELHQGRLQDCLAQLRGLPIDAVALDRPSPLALALLAERWREQLSTETLAGRLARLVADAEAALTAPGPVGAAPRRRRQAGS